MITGRYAGDNSRPQPKRTLGERQTVAHLKERHVLWVSGLLTPERDEIFWDTPGKFRDKPLGVLLCVAPSVAAGAYPSKFGGVASEEPLVEAAIKMQGNTWQPIKNAAGEVAHQLPCIAVDVGGIALYTAATNLQLIRFATMPTELASSLPPDLLEQGAPVEALFIRPYARAL